LNQHPVDPLDPVDSVDPDVDYIGLIEPIDKNMHVEQRLRILVVDDEPGIVDVLTFALREAGFDISVATDGVTALRMALTMPIDLILLDVMLPGIDGLEVCRQVRAASDLPIIIISARTSTGDRIAGLQLFADDYVVKPFSLEEVIARIRTVLRRRRQGIVAGENESNVLSGGCLAMDLSTYQATWNDKPLDLTRIQFDLLAYFLKRPGVVFPRTQLLSEVWGQSYIDDVRTVDSMVKRLRSKLRSAGASEDVIESSRERGYLLQAAALELQVVDEVLDSQQEE
jgi:DNA-binding response OmpR family regulator